MRTSVQRCWMGFAGLRQLSDIAQIESKWAEATR
jgi:hypothetical protein